MYKIAICDDDEKLCFTIENIIMEYAASIREVLAVEVFFSGEELYEHMKTGDYFDFIFLDIKMKVLSGVDVGKLIREELKNNFVQIIYISSFRQYMEELFQVRPMGFLPKPLTENMIIHSLDTGMMLSEQKQDLYTYQIGRDYYKVPLRDILYFKGMRREVKIVTKRGEDHFYSTLKTVYEELKEFQFVSTGRSYIVNYRYIINFTPHELTLTNGVKLPVGKGKYEELKELQQIWERRTLV